MKQHAWALALSCLMAQGSPAASPATPSAAQPAPPPTGASAQATVAPQPAPPPAGPTIQATATPVPPPSAAAKRSVADLEKLAQPIALHPDPLISILLPAAVYPVEIVQAARFVKDTNNISKVDQQPWDENVKSVAKIPALIAQMDANLDWTVQLGQAFLEQPKELMDVIQALRAKAQKAGTLQTTQQQVVTVTNMIVERTVEQQVVVVTNTVVQIQPANPQVVYVPSYPPSVYYPPPGYVYDPWAPLVTFGFGVAMGAIIANNCDWHYGGVYVGHHGVAVWGGGYGDVDIDIDNNFNRNVNVNNPRNPPSSGSRPPGTTTPGGKTPSTMPAQQKWQPDQSRLSKAGAPSASTREARGWDTAGARPSTQPATGLSGARPSSPAAGPRPSTGAVGTRPSTGAVGASPSTGAVGARPSTGTPSVSRPNASPSPSVNRPAPSAAPRDSAFSGAGSAGNARDFSNRGSVSRGSSGFSGGSGGFSGASRSGGFSGGRSAGGFGGGGRGGRR